MSSGRAAGPAIEAFVLGRLHADLYPLQVGVSLDRVETFQRFLGGFAGNVAVGLARLGVRSAVLSGVGDDGLGRYILRTLAEEGVDTSGIRTDPVLRTALTFCELHPPDYFPLTAYRLPTCPDWELRPKDLPLDRIAGSPLLYVGGTALARQPSRSAMFAAMEAHRSADRLDRMTILDLDWRPSYWAHPGAYPGQIARASRLADVVIGGDSEFAAARLDPGVSAARGSSGSSSSTELTGPACSCRARRSGSRARRSPSSTGWGRAMRSRRRSATACSAVVLRTTCCAWPTSQVRSWRHASPAVTRCPRWPSSRPWLPPDGRLTAA